MDARALAVHRLDDGHDAPWRLQLGLAARALPDVKEDETRLVGDSVVLREDGFGEGFADECACHVRTVRIRALLLVIRVGVVEEDLAVGGVVVFGVVANGVRGVVEEAAVHVHSGVGEAD